MFGCCGDPQPTMVDGSRVILDVNVCSFSDSGDGIGDVEVIIMVNGWRVIFMFRFI